MYGDAQKGNCLIGEWPLDESGGLEGHCYSGRVGPAIFTASGLTFGAVGPSSYLPRAITTDGVAGYVSLPDMGTLLVATTTPQAWCFWFHTPTDITSASAVTYLLGGTLGGAIWLGSSTGTLANEVVTVLNGSGANTGFTSFTITAGWHFLVMTYDGTADSWTCYLDGVSVGTKVSAGGGCPGLTTSGNSYRLGNNGTTFYTVLTVAAVSVFSHRLSQAEIVRYLQAGKNGFNVGGRRLPASA
jgi:hypothetical protein